MLYRCFGSNSSDSPSAALTMVSTEIYSVFSSAHFFPVAVNVLGYDPIWFGVIIVMVVAMGVITPPVGMNVFIIKGVAKDISVETIYKGVWPFVLALIACIGLLIAFPQIVTFLPNLLAN